MRDRILAASLRVLHDEGALGFTTTRVADEAGISVGSLYQYFPNKHSLVLALHHDDVRAGFQHVQTVLEQPTITPREKVSQIVLWFFSSETNEVAQFGVVDGDIDVFLRHGVDDMDMLEEIIETLTRFIALNSSTKHKRADLRFLAEFALTTIESVGKSVARRQLGPALVAKWAAVTADSISDAIGFQ